VAQASPFPHHSLDNTIWAARNRDLANVAMDASSSSSDDDLCDDWGTNSGLMIKGDDDELLPWPQTKEEDPTLRAATTAMRSLFAIEEGAKVSEPVFNQLDNNRTTSASDPSSLTDTASTLNAVFQGKLKNAACPAALPAWALSSPVSSPNLVGRSLPAAVEASPTQYLSRVARDYDRSMQMDVDVTMDESWLDESGQLPVHAEDTFSDVEFGSTGGDLPHPECERHLQTAVWAQQQSTALLVKQEPEEFYSSPAGTSSDDVFHESRESSASALSPSSGSELTPYEYSDCDLGPECLVGPESIGMDELDDWLPVTKADRTPLRGRRARNDPSCCSGSWGGIGVIPPQPKATPPPMVRKRSLRSCSRRNNRSTPRKADASAQRLPPTPSPMLEEDPEPELEDESDIIIPLDMSSPLQPETIDIDLELEDAIGADELEQARIEAEAREEEYRAQKRCEAEENRRRWQAYRRAFADAAAGSGSVSPTMIPLDGQSTPWLEGSSSGLWSSTDSVADLAAPACLSPLALQITPVCSAELTSLNPKALLSPLANMMVLDSVLSQADMDVVAATLPPPVPLVRSSRSRRRPRLRRRPSRSPCAPPPVPSPRPLVSRRRQRSGSARSRLAENPRRSRPSRSSPDPIPSLRPSRSRPHHPLLPQLLRLQLQRLHLQRVLRRPPRPRLRLPHRPPCLSRLPLQPRLETL
jgi:hypothetical protein